MEKTIFKKVTMDSAIDELLGSAAAGAGVVGASIAMRMVSKNGKVNPWLVTLLALSSGYGLRLASKNETAKDIGTGILIAGTLDGAKKILNKVTGGKFTENSTMDTINKSIPQLSGYVGQTFNPGFVPKNLRGEYQPAQEVKTPAALLRG